MKPHGFEIRSSLKQPSIIWTEMGARSGARFLGFLSVSGAGKTCSWWGIWESSGLCTSLQLIPRFTIYCWHKDESAVLPASVVLFKSWCVCVCIGGQQWYLHRLNIISLVPPWNPLAFQHVTLVVGVKILFPWNSLNCSTPPLGDVTSSRELCSQWDRGEACFSFLEGYSSCTLCTIVIIYTYLLFVFIWIFCFPVDYTTA